MVPRPQNQSGGKREGQISESTLALSLMDGVACAVRNSSNRESRGIRLAHSAAKSSNVASRCESQQEYMNCMRLHHSCVNLVAAISPHVLNPHEKLS